MKTWEERRRWVLKYLRAEHAKFGNGGHVDVYNMAFVDEYAIATEVKVGVVAYGAFRCPQLGRDLSRMYKEGTLIRQRAGIRGFAGHGFAKWVWAYALAEHARG